MSDASSKNGTAAIELKGINKSFNDLEALRDISLRVNQGEILAILGASGCGKSTLLNIMSGLIPADQGALYINGHPSSQFRDWRRISYMFQEDRLLPWRTIRSNVAFGLEAGHIKRAKRLAKADEALRLVELERFSHAWPHQLSGGMRSRVALARSLVIDPDILLMDEPFSKLDPQTRAQMHEEVLRLHQIKNITVIFVTHDVEEAVILADRVVMLEPRPGRIHGVTALDLPRPRIAIDETVSEQVRQLRMAI